MPVDVLVEKIAERLVAGGTAGLRAESAKPHEVTGLHRHPVAVQQIVGLALQHEQPVLHHMRFGKGDGAARLEGDDVHMHIVAQIIRIDKAGRRPDRVAIRHRCGRGSGIAGDKSLRPVDPLDRGVMLAHPVEDGVALAGRVGAPVRAGRDIGIAARPQVMRRAVDAQPQFAAGDEDHRLRVAVGLGRGAAAARRQRAQVMRECLGKAGHRTRQHPGAQPLPVRQEAGDDVAHHRLRDEGIGLGEDGAVALDRALRRQPARGGRVAVGLRRWRQGFVCAVGGRHESGLERRMMSGSGKDSTGREWRK